MNHLLMKYQRRLKRQNHLKMRLQGALAARVQKNQIKLAKATAKSGMLTMRLRVFDSGVRLDAAGHSLSLFHTPLSCSSHLPGPWNPLKPLDKSDTTGLTQIITLKDKPIKR